MIRSTTPRIEPKQKVAKFQRAVRAALRPLADADRAAGAKAYMRGQFDCLGISTPERRAAVMPLIRAFKPATAEELRETAERLWAMREREYQYVAADLLIRCQGALSLDDLRGCSNWRRRNPGGTRSTAS